MEGLLLSKGCEGGLQDTQKEQRGRDVDEGDKREKEAGGRSWAMEGG